MRAWERGTASDAPTFRLASYPVCKSPSHCMLALCLEHPGPGATTTYRTRFVTRSHTGFQVGSVLFAGGQEQQQPSADACLWKESEKGKGEVASRACDAGAKVLPFWHLLTRGKASRASSSQTHIGLQGPLEQKFGGCREVCLYVNAHTGFGTIRFSGTISAFLETIYRYTLRNGLNKLGTSQQNPRKTHRPILAVESKHHVERGWQTEEFALHEFVYNGPLHASLRKHMFKIELRKRAQVRIESLRGCAS